MQGAEFALIFFELFLETIEQAECVLQRAEPAPALLDERVQLVLPVGQAAALAVGLDLRQRARQPLGALGKFVKRRADRIKHRRAFEQLSHPLFGVALVARQRIGMDGKLFAIMRVGGASRAPVSSP